MRAQVDTASASASDIWPASSMKSVSTTPSMSSREKSHAVPPSSSTSSSGVEKRAWLPEVVTEPLSYESPFLSPRKATPVSSTASIRLWIALWPVEVTPTRRPSEIRWAIRRAPV